MIRYGLGGAEGGLEPVQRAAEVDHPDPIAPGEVSPGQRSGRPHGRIERAARLIPSLLERVQEQYHIARALRMALGHLERAAASGGPPVDVPDPVPDPKRTDVGELNALAASPRDVCAQERLGAQRRHQLSQPLLTGKRAQIHARPHPTLPRRDPEWTVRTDNQSGRSRARPSAAAAPRS